MRERSGEKEIEMIQEKQVKEYKAREKEKRRKSNNKVNEIKRKRERDTHKRAKKREKGKSWLLKTPTVANMEESSYDVYGENMSVSWNCRLSNWSPPLSPCTLLSAFTVLPPSLLQCRQHKLYTIQTI